MLGHLKHLFVVSLILFATTKAMAGDAPTTAVVEYLTSGGSQTLLSQVALNGLSSTRTVVLGTGNKMSKVRLALFYTYSAATAVTVTMSCSLDGTNYAVLQTRNCASGTCTDSDAVDSKTTATANQNYMLEFDVRGCRRTKFVIGGSGSPGAGDLVDAQATGIAG